MKKTILWQYIRMLCLSLLTGCAQFNWKTSQELDSAMQVARKDISVKGAQRISSNDAVLKFIANADVGETRMITRGRSGESALILAGEFYHAASGHLCRRFFSLISDTKIKQGTCASRIACRDRASDWYRVRHIVNIDDPGIGVSGCSSIPSVDP